MADIDTSLVFNPHWIWDPAIWRILDENDKAQATAVINIQLDLIRETLTAQLNAVANLKQLLTP
ncbi:MAG TPA: hypothetical protein VNV18_04740 [Stellaceae bacterium]|jgi:hypothetical protein|nr:hypothetical protein [Stellaceae bacterium]